MDRVSVSSPASRVSLNVIERLVTTLPDNAPTVHPPTPITRGNLLNADFGPSPASITHITISRSQDSPSPLEQPAPFQVAGSTGITASPRPSPSPSPPREGRFARRSPSPLSEVAALLLLFQQQQQHADAREQRHEEQRREDRREADSQRREDRREAAERETRL